MDGEPLFSNASYAKSMVPEARPTPGSYYPIAIFSMLPSRIYDSKGDARTVKSDGPQAWAPEVNFDEPLM